MSLTEIFDKTDTRGPTKGTASHNELLSVANDALTVARDVRLQFERQWYTNIAFYFGRQYLQWTSSAASPVGRLHEPAAPPWRVRMVVNLVRKYVRKEHAKINQEKPIGFVLPASGDDSDLLAARAGDAIIEHLWRELKVPRLVRRATWWVCVTGNGFIKDEYNQGLVPGTSVPGSPDLQLVTPFHIYVPDITQEDIENQPYVVHATAKQKEWVQRTFGVSVPAEGSHGEGVLEEKFLAALQIQNKTRKNLVHVKEAWFKPGGYFPDGAVITWANDEILFFQEGWPYSHGEYPFTKIDHVPTGRFYSESIITDLLAPQKEYNRTRSQIIEAKNRMSKPQLLAPKGSINVQKVTSEPGLIIEYQPGFQPPVPLPLQNLPGYVIDEVNRCVKDMDDISSQHEVSQGQAPPGVSAATAISFLQEQDDTVLSTTVASVEEAVEKSCRHILFHVNENWDEPRKIRVIGNNKQWEAFEFTNANLQGNTDFVVQAGSGTPRSQAAKQAFIMELGKLGWIPPERALRYLEMSETGRLYEEMQVDTRQAQRENLKMAQAIEVTVNTWDNHVSHIEEHDNWRKRQEYENTDPMIKAIFEQHDRIHKAMLLMLSGIPVPPDLDPNVLNMLAYQIMHGIPMGMGGQNAMDSGQGQPAQEGFV